ncbi:energy transducer TonB [Nostoc sp. 'Lobaria pulmonaria (5183) cyanobiont']|uniref:energy transducer TonB n=1 Tax=Nostoc sp. 'Lobaria pulmonaria (5183) cyanobiont' TaxID=1618022 RepID=UPI000CF317D8|nr:energy transducer TonB [Nostoc sp. 'Lobaria pulmonaria (5183) cyanobiont']
MSFYNIAVSVFLAYSPIGSLALDTTVVLPVVSNIFQLSSEKYEPIEATKKFKPVKQLKPNETNSPQFQTIEPDSQKLTQCLRRLRDSRARQSSGVSGSAVQSNNLGASNAIVGLGSGTGIGPDQPGNRSTVATAPTPPKINTSGNGRAACQEGGCRSKYPESARGRRIEGRVEMAVDTDAQGNVTNVRLIRSSGNRNLDEEVLRQARNSKLKPASGGRQGVLVPSEYAIADS